MNRQQFLDELRKRLCGLSQDDIEEKLMFFEEMIDDRMEEGESEVEAVSAVGELDEIVQQIIEEIPMKKLVKARVKQRKKISAWNLIFLILGSPIWVSLLIAAFAVVFSLYISLWAVIISLWAVDISLGGCALGGLASAIVFMVTGNTAPGVAMIGASLICVGLMIFGFFGCKIATKGTIVVTKKMLFGIKKLLVGKEEQS